MVLRSTKTQKTHKTQTDLTSAITVKAPLINLPLRF